MILTTSHHVFCDTYNTECELKMHEVEVKADASPRPPDKSRKLQLTITGKDGSKQQISLWREDVILLSKFLEDISDDISNKL